MSLPYLRRKLTQETSNPAKQMPQLCSELYIPFIYLYVLLAVRKGRAHGCLLEDAACHGRQVLTWAGVLKAADRRLEVLAGKWQRSSCVTAFCPSP